jgi:diacylglycerol kinase family enzyme
VTPFETFRALFASWLGHTPLFADRALRIDVILNPHAGAFRHRRRCAELIGELRGRRLPEGRRRPAEVAVWTTEKLGHETSILEPRNEGDRVRLVITGGGDGTSRGALISALGLENASRANVVFFRLPLGTGNDAADCANFAAALDVLAGAPSRVEPLPVIEVCAEGHEPHYSFNIASVGLDAFVAYLTNGLKKRLPGNSYSLAVDFVAMFYEAFVPMAVTSFELTHEGRPVLNWSGAFSLAALGTTGRKTYGAGKKILPDDDNFCLAAVKSPFTKLSYRQPVYNGTHRSLKGFQFASGDQLKVTSPVRIPLQMDGEVLWLDPENFPLTMSVTDRGLRVLKPFG